MLRLPTLPLALAGLGTLVGLVSWSPKFVFLGALAGYFLAKLVQSLVWTISGPTTAA